mgnify:FL=1|tara:strand:- start:3012 stop:4400 length:1389 start_codon:yes stop_codon:yes gene_type:complete
MKLSKIKNIHFIGIGGVGMVGIAEMLLNQGFAVSGSDLVENKNTERLKYLGAKIFIGHNEKNVRDSDVVVYSTAVTESNPEMRCARSLNKTIIARAEMLSSLMRGFQSIAVAGSHGKTTTTSLVANIFIKAKLDPTYIIGGRILGQEDKSILGSSEYLIVEADESDASFLHLSPEISVITNVDNDHLDFYENNIEKLNETFHQFLENLPFYGTAIICIDEERAKKLFNDLARPKISYGFSRSADYYLKDLKQVSNFQEFTLVRNSVGKEVRLKLKIAGRHNALNATAAYIVAKEAGITTKTIKDSLKSFGGVSRRLEFKGDLKISNKKIKLLDDYGHHPTEISATVAAIKSSNKNKKVNMIFQPHRYSRSSILFDDFIECLGAVDKVIILDIYSAGEQNTESISSYDFVNSLIKKGKKAFFAKNLKEISKILEAEVKNNEILVTQGAGNIVDISNSLLAMYK